MNLTKKISFLLFFLLLSLIALQLLILEKGELHKGTIPEKILVSFIILQLASTGISYALIAKEFTKLFLLSFGLGFCFSILLTLTSGFYFNGVSSLKHALTDNVLCIISAFFSLIFSCIPFSLIFFLKNEKRVI